LRGRLERCSPAVRKRVFLTAGARQGDDRMVCQLESPMDAPGNGFGP
jgi:hypothetical protein